MCKKLCFLIISALMLSLTSASYGEVVIGDFEQQMDGWAACGWGPPGNPTFSYGTSGVTLGSSSLKAEQPTGWYWFLINNSVNGDDFRANNIISMDVTRLADEWTRGTGNHQCNLDLRVQDNSRYALTGLGNRGDWDSNDLNANDTMTLTWDYTLFKRQMPAAATGVEIVIATNTGGYTGMGTWYIDNVKLIASRHEQPRNGACGVELNPTLQWAEASPSDRFDVYVGTDFNDVDNADRTNQTGLLFYSENQDPNNFSLSGTTNGTTYYWRTDDVVGGTPVKGPVWHFTTFLLGAKSTVIGDWERQMDGWVAVDPNDPNMVLGYSTAGATLNEYSLSVNIALTTWYAAVEIPLDEAGFTYQCKANNRFALDVTRDISEFGTHIHSITIDGDGIEGLQLAPMSSELIGSEGGLFTRRFIWDYSATDFSLLPPDANLTLSIATNNSSGLYYFDNARLYNSKVASGSMPADKAADVQREPTLSWTPGEGAGTHDIYFGTDYDKVNDANRADHPDLLFYDEDLAYDANNIDITGELGYPLSFGTTYYWRVDEVNEIVWKGEVWSFTVGWYLVVDDFEDYNDYEPNRIFDVWTDFSMNNTGMTVGHLDPPFAEKSIVHGGYQAMYMRYDNDGTVNEGTDYEQSGTLLYSETERQWTDPQDWTREGVTSLTLWFRGVPASVGSFAPQGQAEGPPITMTAGGEDIWGTADRFHFAYKQLSGVGSITAKILSVSNTDPWAKAGVMIRESLEPGSPHTTMVVTPENGVSFQRRTVVNAVSEQTQQADITAPQWVKLTRSGNTFTGEYSANGSNWTTLGSVDIAMLPDTYIGLCLTSHDISETCTAEFSNVTTSGTGEWQSQDIGIESNIGEPMYIVLEDNAGGSAVVKHPDPAATTIGAWTEWNIPFTDFTGVNMQAIKKMVIGVGDRANPQLGSTGDLYIDDIWLILPTPEN
jgi:hypothetical protein